MKNNIYSVGQVNAYIKNMFAQDFVMNHIYVRGEVSNCKYHSSGHIFFTLKDSSGVLNAVMFAGNRKRGLTFPMKEGDRVVVLGAIRIYERDGKYQLYADSITQEGAGDLYRRYEELKRKLEDMGMFSSEYKKPIPRYAHTVGVVTAPTGAAVRDIQNIAARRNPFVQLILYPAQVQGEGAAESIVRGIRSLEAYGVDVMIVGRGGGSIEDLWAFNEEIVARAIFDCTVPVISAVGHETDTTISDYVADLRAPTPSAAAELAVFDIHEVLDRMKNISGKLDRRMREELESEKNRAEQYGMKLKIASPESRLAENRQRSAECEDRLRRAMEKKIADCRHQADLRNAERLQRAMQKRFAESRHRAELLAASLDGVSPLKKISSGYAAVADAEGRPVRSAGKAEVGDMLLIRMRDGELKAEVKERTLFPAGR